MFKNLKIVFRSIFLAAFFSADVAAQTSLKAAFKDYFLIGASLNRAQIFEKDAVGANIVKTQFSTISPENILKWGSVHPQADKYDFDAADRYVEFGERNKMFIVGHTLIWHNQTPEWVFKNAAGKQISRAALLERMREHIETVVGRYKGRINGWDVVNEALNDDGTLRQTPWLKIIGKDYIAKAFQYAHEADPNTELYYNDYSLENEAKRRGAIKLVRELLALKIPVKAVGLQGHDNFDFPTVEQQTATIEEFAGLGIKVNVSELDVSVLPDPKNFNGAEVKQDFKSEARLNPYVKGLPTAAQQKLANRYVELFRVFLAHHRDIERITFWNVTDGDSWLNNFPVRGRTNYPLLFDRDGKTKSAFDAVIQSALNFKDD